MVRPNPGSPDTTWGLSMGKSCIVEQFNRYAELTHEESELLDSLEREPQSIEAGAMLRAEGDEAHNFFTLRSGWAYASRTLADGERQVLDIFLPGQVIGLREIGYGKALSSIVILSDAVVCPFPKSRLMEVFEQAPRLSALFFLSLATEEAMLIERIINVSRRSAAQRLAHFLIEMKIRLKVDCSDFELPMNQTIIGDTLGLTAVHISRTFKCLREENLVTFDEGSIHIQDMQALIDFAGFDGAYLGQQSSFAKAAA